MPDHHLLIPCSLGAAVFSPPLGFVGLEKPEAQEQQNRGGSGSGFEDMHLSLLLPLPAGARAPGPGRDGCVVVRERRTDPRLSPSRHVFITDCTHVLCLALDTWHGVRFSQ